MYYAFYAPQPDPKQKGKHAPQHWNGDVELRGLAAKTYRVTDYVHHKHFGNVVGPTAKLKVDFTDSLLLEVTPAS